MSRFTAEEAFDASAEGQPIMLCAAAAHRLCAEHGTTLVDYDLENGTFGSPNPVSEYDAAAILGWLGY
jgi:hypothetical protein